MFYIRLLIHNARILYMANHDHISTTEFLKLLAAALAPSHLVPMTTC